MDKKETAKDRILRVASDLFYREGVRAVGIDRIIEESGVAKASFYRNFATKDDLVVAYLEMRESVNLERVDEAQRRFPDSPLRQLYALVEGLTDRMKKEDFRGCPFMNTVVEFPDGGHPGHRKAVESRRSLWKKVEEIAREGGALAPEEFAGQLRMLCSGALMYCYIDKEAFRSEDFLTAAREMIEKHLGGKRLA